IIPKEKGALHPRRVAPSVKGAAPSAKGAAPSAEGAAPSAKSPHYQCNRLEVIPNPDREALLPPLVAAALARKDDVCPPLDQPRAPRAGEVDWQGEHKRFQAEAV